MGLFDFKDYKVVISPDAVAIPAFKTIWERDKTKEKHKATQELSYIYFVNDFKSPYSIYPEEDRRAKVLSDFIKNPDWVMDAELKIAEEEYNEFQKTYSMRFLESARGLADKLTAYFDEVDFHATDERGKPTYSATDAVRNLKEVGNVIESLDKVEEKVKKEIDSQTKVRGKKVIRDRER
jgi:hypothetical protein